MSQAVTIELGEGGEHDARARLQEATRSAERAAFEVQRAEVDVRTREGALTVARLQLAAVPAFNVDLALEAAEVVYRKGTIRDVSLGFDVHKGALAVSRVRAILPGGMVLSATSAVTGGPAQPVASGEFLVIGPRLRETLTWLEIDVAGVPAERLQTFEARGRMVSQVSCGRRPSRRAVAAAICSGVAVSGASIMICFSWTMLVPAPSCLSIM